MGEKEGGGYRHRAKGHRGVVVYLPAEVHALLVRLVGRLTDREGRRVTIQEWLAGLVEGAVRQELGEPAPEAQPAPRRGRGKRKGEADAD